MRSELVLTLWLIAGAIVTWLSMGEQLLSGDGFLPTIIKPTHIADAAGTFAVESTATERSPQSLFEIAVSDRLLFAVVSVPLDKPIPVDAREEAALDFALRGIIRRDDSWRAIFEGRDGQSQYLVLGVGEAIGPYRVVALAVDRVVLMHAADGTRNTVFLRGSGEAQ